MSLTLTAATAADYPAFQRLFTELAVPEPTPSAERFEAMVAPDAVFARDGSDVLGYAWARVRGDRLHVVHVVSDPAHRRRGVGRRLMDAAAARGRAAGLSRWMLNVKPDNVAARALYERCGLRVTFESTQMQLQWRDLTKLPLAEGVSVRPLSAADDARFEEASALSPGELSAFRPLGRMLVGAERAFAAVGVAAFDPSFPGASPFLARGRGLARPLLEAMRPGALPHHDHLFVFVEGDPPLEAELAAAGAEARLRVLRMEGEIPEMP